jgi:hypothetical protein
MEELIQRTLTAGEWAVVARGLVVLAQMNDALDKHKDAVEALDIWERVAPETVA